jgi:hypothetical protein
MIDGSETIVGPRGLTKNQIIQLVNLKYGGWPVKATKLYQFESKDPKETVYRFADERGLSLGKKRLFEKPLWTLVLTSDDYYMKYLSREAREKIIAEVKGNLLARLVSVVR